MLRTSLLALLLALAPHPAIAQVADFDTLAHDIWEYDLKQSPVFASAIGDLRYNDQLPDLSPRAANERLAVEHGFLIRLLTIDTTSLSAQQRQSADLIQRELLHDEEAARFKQWELPIDQSHGIQTDLPAMIELLPFVTVKDFDDYIARLHLVPRQLRQASENLLAGIDDLRVESAEIIGRALKQTEELAAQTPADSPFARPLKQFPATIDAAQQKRISAAMLDAIQSDVLPAYSRFAKFLRVTELAAATDAAQPDHSLSYQVREMKVLELRARAKSTLGPRFDLTAFHKIVASDSALPVEVLEQQINAWIAASK